MAKTFIAEFDTCNGKVTRDIEADSLEDATINASNMADDEEWELLSVDDKQLLLTLKYMNNGSKR